jgi:hypothetical protein
MTRYGTRALYGRCDSRDLKLQLLAPGSRPVVAETMFKSGERCMKTVPLSKPYMMIYCQHDHPPDKSRVYLLLLSQTEFFHHSYAHCTLSTIRSSLSCVMQTDPQTRLESCSKVRFSSSRDDRLRTRASGPLVPTSSPNTPRLNCCFGSSVSIYRRRHRCCSPGYVHMIIRFSSMMI